MGFFTDLIDASYDANNFDRPRQEKVDDIINYYNSMECPEKITLRDNTEFWTNTAGKINVNKIDDDKKRQDYIDKFKKNKYGQNILKIEEFCNLSQVKPGLYVATLLLDNRMDDEYLKRIDSAGGWLGTSQFYEFEYFIKEFGDFGYFLLGLGFNDYRDDDYRNYVNKLEVEMINSSVSELRGNFSKLTYNSSKNGDAINCLNDDFHLNLSNVIVMIDEKKQVRELLTGLELPVIYRINGDEVLFEGNEIVVKDSYGYNPNYSFGIGINVDVDLFKLEGFFCNSFGMWSNMDYSLTFDKNLNDYRYLHYIKTFFLIEKDFNYEDGLFVPDSVCLDNIPCEKSVRLIKEYRKIHPDTEAFKNFILNTIYSKNGICKKGDTKKYLKIRN